MRRALRLRVAVVRYALRRLGPPLLAALAYTLAAVRERLGSAAG